MKLLMGTAMILILALIIVGTRSLVDKFRARLYEKKHRLRRAECAEVQWREKERNTDEG